MSERFFEWVAQRALEDSLRFGVFVTAAGVVLVYLLIGTWPKQLQPWGKAFMMEFGGIVYAALLAFSFWALVLSLGLGR